MHVCVYVLKLYSYNIYIWNLWKCVHTYICMHLPKQSRHTTWHVSLSVSSQMFQTIDRIHAEFATWGLHASTVTCAFGCGTRPATDWHVNLRVRSLCSCVCHCFSHKGDPLNILQLSVALFSGFFISHQKPLLVESPWPFWILQEEQQVARRAQAGDGSWAYLRWIWSVGCM